MKELLFLLVLFVSNVIQAITGFAGTVLAMPPSVYLLGLDHAKVVLNFFLMVTQFRSGLVGTADIRLICISILPLLIATWLGKKLVCKVSQKVFLNLTYILLLISGVSLIV